MGASALPFLGALAFFLMPGRAFWPYFIGSILLLVGLAVIIPQELRQARGLDKAVVFGRLFLAVPMGVFGGDHFIAPKIIAGMVPSWIPWHLFWAYFVGTGLIAAAFSIILKRYSTLAAALLGLMILSFVLFIHIPNLSLQPDRFVLAVALRDLAFSGGALAFAITQVERSPRSRMARMQLLVRWMIAISAVFFGIEHFLHPLFVPVVPLNRLMPSWIPGQIVLAYVTGCVLIVTGISIIVNWKARLAATWLGITVFVIVLLVYLPLLLATPADIDQGLNYLADTLAYGGSALVLAGALPKENPTLATADEPKLATL